jgi:hypothetical protein
MWLFIPSTALPSAPESECLTKDCAPDLSTWDSNTDLPLTSKGKLLRPASLLRLWKQGQSIRRLSTLTCAPSTVALGVERWIASLPDSPVSRIASPGNVKDSKTNAGYGLTSLESFAKLNQHMCGSKTCGDLFQPEGLSTSYLTLPDSGSMRNGRLCQQPRSALRTSGSGSSSWPTADCNTSTYSNGKFGMNLREAAATWPTARSSDGEKGGPNQRGSKGDMMLPSAAAQWMTPMVPNGGRVVSPELVASKEMTDAGEKRTVGLESQTRHWPTPDANATTRSNTSPSPEAAERPALAALVQTWPTPAARDMKGENSLAHLLRTDGRTDGRIHHIDQLPNFVMYHFSRQGQTMNDGQKLSAASHTSPRRLNPAFACWLMGWPWWWTNPAPISCAKSEMELYRSKLQQRLSCLLDEQG